MAPSSRARGAPAAQGQAVLAEEYPDVVAEEARKLWEI
jgi:hypothetical protein